MCVDVLHQGMCYWIFDANLTRTPLSRTISWYLRDIKIAGFLLDRSRSRKSVKRGRAPACCFKIKGDTLSALNQHCAQCRGGMVKLSKRAMCTMPFDQDCCYCSTFSPSVLCSKQTLFLPRSHCMFSWARRFWLLLVWNRVSIFINFVWNRVANMPLQNWAGPYPHTKLIRVPSSSTNTLPWGLYTNKCEANWKQRQ